MCKTFQGPVAKPHLELLALDLKACVLSSSHTVSQGGGLQTRRRKGVGWEQQLKESVGG